MKFSNQKLGIKYRAGFIDALKEALLQLKKNKDQPIENIIKGFELTIKLLEERK